MPRGPWVGSGAGSVRHTHITAFRSHLLQAAKTAYPTSCVGTAVEPADVSAAGSSHASIAIPRAMLPAPVTNAMTGMDEYLARCGFHPFYPSHRSIVAALELPRPMRLKFVQNFNEVRNVGAKVAIFSQRPSRPLAN